MEAKNKRDAVTVGIIKEKKVISTKKGTPMAFIKLFDEVDEIEITIFPTTYSECSSILDKNNIVVAKIRRDRNGDEINYLADEVHLLEKEEN